ncbi:MAG: hypothetical protein M1450_05000 [Patescibacteria group bacterium]|nr:hypothetical protein [Patescibacteria group bacterium]
MRERAISRGIIGPTERDIASCNQLATDTAYLQRQKWIGRITWGAAAALGIPTATSLALIGCSAPAQQETAPAQTATATSTPTITARPTNTPEPQRSFKRSELARFLTRTEDLFYIGDKFLRQPFGSWLSLPMYEVPEKYLADITDKIKISESTASLRSITANDLKGEDMLNTVEITNSYSSEGYLIESQIKNRLVLGKNEEVKDLLDENQMVAKDKLFDFVNILYKLPEGMVWKTFTFTVSDSAKTTGDVSDGRPIDVIKAAGMSESGITYVVEADSWGHASLNITIPSAHMGTIQK